MKCPDCGNPEMIEGGDIEGNQHEWHCKCGYSLHIQSNKAYEFRMGERK